MNELRRRAKELLESGAVQVVIGYENGSADRTRAAFVFKPEDAARLVFDSRCVQNLAVYLTRREIKALGKPAVVAPLPVLRSLLQLAVEHQVREEDLVVLAVTPDGRMPEMKTFAEIEQYLGTVQWELDARYREIIDHIRSLPLEERWAHWVRELSRCFKCYACRAACPLCYCERCAVENNQPQWIPPASHALGDLEWHVLRAMHHAGRCTDCDACARACPLGIPLNLLTKFVMEDLRQQFGVTGPSLETGNALASFKPDDKESFIR